MRKRVAGKQTSTYVGAYTEELYNLLLRNAREAREIRKELRSIDKQLANAGYSEDELSSDVINNIAFARANMKMNIYDQAVLEGVATSFPQTEEPQIVTGTPLILPPSAKNPSLTTLAIWLSI